jgi:hypothetical protein
MEHYRLNKILIDLMSGNNLLILNLVRVTTRLTPTPPHQHQHQHNNTGLPPPLSSHMLPYMPIYVQYQIHMYVKTCEKVILHVN